MGEKRTLARHGSIYILATLVARGTPFALMIVYANLLEPVHFGLVGTLVAAVGLLSVFVGLRPNIYVVKHFHQAQGAFAERVGSLYFILAVTFVAALAVMLLASPWLPVPAESALVFALAVTCLAGVRGAHQLPDSILISSGQPVRYAASQAVLAAGLVVLSLPLVYLVRSWEAMALGTAVATALAAVLSSLFVVQVLGRREGTRLFRPNRQYAGEAFAFLFPVSFHVIGFTAVTSVDRLILMDLKGAEMVGAYTAAYTLAMVVGVGHEALLKVWNPYFFRRVAADGVRLQRMLGPQSLYAVVSIVTAVAYGLAAQWGFGAIFPDVYGYAAAIVPVICLAYGLEGARKVFCGQLYVFSRTKTLAAISLAAAVLNIALNILWIPEHGVAGAAWATLAAFAVMTTAVVAVSVYLSWAAEGLAAERVA